MSNDNGSGVGLSIRELLLEVRQDVRDLSKKIDHIDRHGSIGTREELSDHETRIRKNELWRYAISTTLVVAIVGGATSTFLSIYASLP